MKLSIIAMALLATTAFAGTNVVADPIVPAAFEAFQPDKVIPRRSPADSDGIPRLVNQAVLNETQTMTMWVAMRPMLVMPPCATNMHIERFSFFPQTNGTMKLVATWAADVAPTNAPSKRVRGLKPIMK